MTDSAIAHPPPDWPQRVRTDLPFPPGRNGERFETYLDRDPGMQGWERFEINLHTLEVFAQRGTRWSAPGWMQLPERVRARIWHLHGGERG